MMRYAEGLRKLATGEGDKSKGSEFSWSNWLGQLGSQLSKDYSWSDNGTENLIRWGGTGLAGLAGWLLPGQRSSFLTRLISALLLGASTNRAANYYLDSTRSESKPAIDSQADKSEKTPESADSSVKNTEMASQEASSSYIPGSGKPIEDPAGKPTSGYGMSGAGAFGAGAAGAGYGAYAGKVNWDAAKKRFNFSDYGPLDFSPAKPYTPGSRLTKMVATYGKGGANPNRIQNIPAAKIRQQAFDSRFRRNMNIGAHAIGYGLPMAVAGMVTPRAIHGLTGGKD